MKTTFRRRGIVLAAALVLLWAVSAADTGGGSASFVGTGWALLPPAVAIVLAFITKEVYSSLLAGCVMGALLAEGFAPWRSFETLFLTLMEGIDRKIFFFDVLLGAIVVLFARSGGSRAFGEWASRRVRSRRGAETATATLGCLIFLDDYFNCLTVGAIMQPIADRFRISREKLAFLIDATAAPVCIIAPISSWAAAVSSYIPAEYAGTVNGFTLFLRAIPYNFYALLMLWMVFVVALTGRDFGPMYRREQLAAVQEPPRDDRSSAGQFSPRGRAVDLLVPTVCLIVSVVWGMVLLGRRTCREGGLPLTASNVFANTDAPMALCFGCAVTLLVMAVLYIPRGVVTFSGYVEGFLDGFKLMTPALLVLTFAWGLKSFAARLDAAAFVQGLFAGDLDGPVPAGAVSGGRAAGLCHRHQLGHHGHSHSRGGAGVCRQFPAAGGGGGGVRRGRYGRPLLPYFRHHHHELHRRRVRSHGPCYHPAVVRPGGRRRLCGLLSAGGGAGRALASAGCGGGPGGGAGIFLPPAVPAAGGGGMKQLPVPFIGQGHSLPTGCESVSAAMALQYLGFSVTAEDFARDHLPSAPFYRDTGGVWHGPDPRRAFVGDPHDPDALGCWAPAIKSGMSRFLAGLARDKAGIYRVKNETGAELGYLCRRYIDRGIPVLIWISIDLRPTVNGPWYRTEPEGQPFMWISNEHCVVLSGYDREHYICCDPWEDRGVVRYPRETVWQRHRELGMQAVAVEGPV